jgi:drug/metabolite transporter (DMT)-like permease
MVNGNDHKPKSGKITAQIKERPVTVNLGSIILMLVYLACSTSGLVLIRLGAATASCTLKAGQIQLSLSGYSLAGICLYAISFLLWMTLLSRFQLSYIAPVLSGASYILILLAAFFILHETIGRLQLLGASIILCGIIIMNIKT